VRAPGLPAAPADGTIDALDLVLATDRSEYFALTYWSDGLRVKGFLTYPGDDHSLSGSRYGLPEILAWLGQHLGGPGEDHSYARNREAIADTMERWPR